MVNPSLDQTRPQYPTGWNCPLSAVGVKASIVPWDTVILILSMCFPVALNHQLDETDWRIYVSLD